MRFFLFIAILSALASPAKADQFDPALAQLFVDLREGRGDASVLEAEIESRWLMPPEEGTAILVERAVKAIDEDRLAVAETLVAHITSIAPSFAEGFVLEGRLALARNDTGTALRAFRRAVSLEPRHYYALERLGDLALMLGDKPRAHEHYRDALDWHPRQPMLQQKTDRLRTEIYGREI
ncbi:tetratricopeptide repeat protein [Parvularcula marina]|nr:tetratricopeptide repeat protein [Parvularcula marina]